MSARNRISQGVSPTKNLPPIPLEAETRKHTMVREGSSRAEGTTAATAAARGDPEFELGSASDGKLNASTKERNNSWAQDDGPIDETEWEQELAKHNAVFNAKNSSAEQTQDVNTKRAAHECEREMEIAKKSVGLVIAMPKVTNQARPAPPPYPFQAANIAEKKTRAVTEPLLSKTFFNGRKPSYKGIRAMFTGEKSSFKSEGDIQGKEDFVHPSPAQEDLSVPISNANKASRLLGFVSGQRDEQLNVDQPPAFTLHWEPPDTYRDSVFDGVPALVTKRYANSTPISPHPTKGQSDSAEEVMFRGQLRSPTKLGIPAAKGRPEFVKNGFSRVASHVGVIETAENSEAEPNEILVQALPSVHTDELLPSTVYSPSIYTEFWEDEHKVGGSNLESSPANPAENYRRLITESDVLKDSDNDLSITSSFQHMTAPSIESTNSWNTDTVTSANPKVVHRSAEVLPLFASEFEDEKTPMADNCCNSVPKPPTSFPGFTPSEGFDFAHMQLSLHHHLDSVFDRLSRTVTDKTDKILDETYRKLEALEDKFLRSSKTITRQDINGLKNEFETLGHDVHVNATNSLTTKKTIQAISKRLEEMDAKIANCTCKCNHTQADNELNKQNIQISQPSSMHPSAVGEWEQSYGSREVSYQGPVNQSGPYLSPRRRRQYSNLLQINGPTGINFGPQGREISEEYYRMGWQYPNIMTAVTTESDMSDQAVLAVYGEDDNLVKVSSIALEIEGPNGIFYNLPSFMSVDKDGHVVLKNFDEDGSPSSSGGGVSPRNIGPRQLTHEIPSLMSITDDGYIVIDTEMKDHAFSRESRILVGIRGPIGVLYELPTFMNTNGQVDIDHPGSGHALVQSSMPTSTQETSGNLNQSPLSTTLTMSNDHVETKRIADVNPPEKTPIPNGIRGPNGIVYEIPSFMSINEDGHEEIIQQEEPILPRVDVAPVGIRAPNGIVYKIPSFMSINENGLEEIIHEEPVLPQVNAIPVGIRGSNGVVYEIPSFMSINEDGLEEVNLQEEPILPRVDCVPHGIRGPNGVIYELPSFMTISMDGHAQIRPDH